MSTPRTRSRSQSGHRDSETRTKVARWAPCVLSCLPSFWHCYTCSRLPTEVRPLNLSALRLIRQCSIILHVIWIFESSAKVFKSCIIVYSARIWSSVEKLQTSQSVCWTKGSLTEKLIHTCEARVCLPVYTINPQFGDPSFSRFRWGLFACIGQSGSASRRSEVLK